MKIALVSQEYPPETAKGGIGSQTYMKAKGLSALGHEVFVISRSNDQRSEIMDGNICIIRIPGMEDYLYQMTDIVEWITHSTLIAAEIDALNNRVGLDIIDFPEWGAEGYVYLLNRTKWYGVPTVIQLHGPLVMFTQIMGWPEMKTNFYQVGTHMEATCVRLADAVYSSSKCSTGWIKKYYTPEKEKIPTIHLGVNTDFFKPLSIKKNDKTTIVFVGKIVKNKGVEELIEATSKLIKEYPDLQVEFYGQGNGKYLNHLKEKAMLLGVIKHLHFKGFIDKGSLPDVLNKVHLFAAPSHYEGGPGFVYLEAMACGLPVVGCSGSGIDEIIDSGRNGLLVPPQNTNELIKALKKLLADKELTSKMAYAAREFVVQQADTKLCLKKLEAFYYSVIQLKQAVHSKVLQQ